MTVNKTLKIKVESRHPETGKVVGKATFKLDDDDVFIWMFDPLNNAVEHFTDKYMKPFSQLCCDVHCLLKVNTTASVG